MSKLRHHRVFRQNEIAMYPHERHLIPSHSGSSLHDAASMRKVKNALGHPIRFSLFFDLSCVGWLLLFLRESWLRGCLSLFFFLSPFLFSLCLSVRSLLSPNRLPSTRLRSASGSIPQKTWTNAAEVTMTTTQSHYLSICLFVSFLSFFFRRGGWWDELGDWD